MYTLHNKIEFAAPLDEDFEMLLGRSIEQGGFDDMIFIVPTGRRTRLVSRTAVRSLARKSGLPAGELPVFTLERFVRLCARQLMGAKCPRLVSDAYRLALMEEAAEKADLRFFRGGRNSLSPAALERLTNVIHGLKEDGVTPASLWNDVRRAETGAQDAGEELDANRLRDIASLYEMYEALLGATLADYPRLLNIVSQVLRGERDPLTMESIAVPDDHPLSIRERWEAIFPGKKALLIDGFSEFKKPEQDFLSLLAFAPFHVRIYLDYSKKNGPLFGNLEETLGSLQHAGFNTYAPDEDIEKQVGYERKKHQPLVSYLRRWLFNTEKDIRHEGFGDMIRVLGVESRVEETRAIAKLVKHLVLEEKIPLSEIAVVMRQPAPYASLFREMFALYDIPANVTDRYPLEKSPVVIAVFAVLDAVLLGFRRGDVHRALQSPYIRCTRREKGEEIPLDAANLYEVASRLRINGGDRFGGADGWFERLDRRLDYLRNRMATLERDVLADPDEVRQTRRELESVGRAWLDFDALVNLLPRPGQLTPMEFSEVVQEQILQRLSVRERIEEFHATTKRYEKESGVTYIQLQEEVEKDARAMSAFILLVEELAAIFEERSPGRHHPLQEYTDRLRTATRAQRYATREKTGYGVTITSIEQIRNIPFQVTILCGAVDSEFPAAYVPESFLGKELPDSEDRFIKRERLQFFQAIVNHAGAFEDSRKRVYITYPLYRGSEEIVRSSFVDALLKVVPLRDANCELNLVELRRERMYDTGNDEQWKYVQWTEALGNSEELLYAVGRRKALAGANDGSERPFVDVLDSTRLQEVERIERFIEAKMSGTYRPGEVVVRPETLTTQAQTGLLRYGAKPYSVTDLEGYKSCPYRFFVRRLLLLQEKEEFDTSLSPLEQGNFLHRILYRFYRVLQDEAMQSGEAHILPARTDGMPPLIPIQLDGDDEERYRGILLDIAREEIEQFHFDHVFFELDKEMLLGTEGRPGKLELWLKEELKRVREGWFFLPALFEFGFGGKAVQEGRTEPHPVEVGDGVLLRGKIDRIEIETHTGGDVEFLIGDYKTGRLGNLPGNAPIRKGESLQMPLYAAAARKLLARHYGLNAEPSGAVYYTLTPERNKNGETESHRFVLLPKDTPLGQTRKSRSSETVAGSEEREQMIAESIHFAKTYIDGITGGRFTVEPVDRAKTCSYCSFHPVCRIREATPE